MELLDSHPVDIYPTIEKKAIIEKTIVLSLIKYFFKM